MAKVLGVSLEARIAELEALNADQAAVIEAQAVQIDVLAARVAELEARLDPSDSGNSSLPPSRDGRSRRQRRAEEREARSQARAESGGKKRSPGKQPGAPGSTLQRRAADITRRYQPPCCERCAADLTGAVVVGEVTRQVLDVPEPRLIATDHVAEKRRCGCGHTTTAGFPAEATAPVCWGPRTKAVAVYLMIRQHLPLERAAEAMAVLFAAPVSQGSLATWPLKTAKRLSPFTAALRGLLALSAVVCADETPIRVGTGTGYVHTVATDTLTFLAYHAGRGFDAIDDIGLLGDYRGTIMHDGLSVYDRDELAKASHAQCHAHLDRHLVKVGAWQKHAPWCEQMRRLFVDIHAAHRVAVAAGKPTVDAATATGLRDRYDTIIDQAFEILPEGRPPRRRNQGGWTPKDRDAWNLATRFRTQRPQILALLDDTRIPATNNDAERSLRMCKLHDKIAGHFRNPDNAEAFCTIRSYIQTGRKQARDTLTDLINLQTGTPWQPNTT